MEFLIKVMSIFQKKIIVLDPKFKKIIILIVDAILLIISLISSYWLRFGEFYLPFDNHYLFFLLPPIIGLPIFYSFGLYNSVIRFIGLSLAVSSIKAISIYSVTWGLIAFMISLESISDQSIVFSRSVIIINCMICIFLVLGSRFFARWLFTSERLSKLNQRNVIIYGASLPGRELSNTLKLSNKYNHIAYIDDIEKGRQIDGISVYSSDQIENLIYKLEIKDIFLALPDVSKKNRNLIIDQLSEFSVKVRTLPSFEDLDGDRVKINDLHEIDIEDLLGREIVLPISRFLKSKIQDKVVLVSGAGGSIGSELCRQIIALNPKTLIIFDISESSIYEITTELTSLNNSTIKIIPVIGSVRDSNKLMRIVDLYKVETFYHAAAYKHVPLLEYNQSEAVLNNIIGTYVAAKTAIKLNIETFVLISSDKAVRPTNTMGATKRISELILKGLSGQAHKTCFTMVRFGNVLDSSGSVIPLFTKQIKNGGPVTVTAENIVRYFMTIPEAVELVIQAGAMGKGGDLFLLEMGQPVKISELAEKMIKLSGLTVLNKDNPDGDIEIKYIGLRPGEKLFEELLVDEKSTKTEHKLIMKAEESTIEWNDIEYLIVELERAALILDSEKIRELLIKLVPEFSPQSPILDLTYNKQVEKY